MLGDGGMVGADIADEAHDEALRLEPPTGEVGDKFQRSIEDVGGHLAVELLLRFPLREGLVLLLEPLREGRFRGGWDVERAQRAAQGLNRAQDVAILPIPPVEEVGEGDDFHEVEERRRFVAAQLEKLLIEVPASLRKAIPHALLLVLGVRLEVDAIGWAGDADHAVLSAACTADQPVEGWTGPFPFSRVAVNALSHRIPRPLPWAAWGR